MLTSRPVAASVGDKVSFTWRANPAGDHIVGYRLYYGGSSRFTASGAPRPNFSYDYYIDFAKLKRCVPGSNGTQCKKLDPRDIQCRNLLGGTPSCTVSRLHGHLYFALTAYNAKAESGFTPELKTTVNPRGLAAVQRSIANVLFSN